MKIIIISRPNPFVSTGTLAYDLHKFFLKNGIISKLIVEKINNNEQDIIGTKKIYFSFLERIISYAKYLFNKYTIKIYFKTDKNYYFEKFKREKNFLKIEQFFKKIPYKPDAIIVLFSQGFLNMKNLYELYKKFEAPIFWYMMDMEAITGGCHYSWDCKEYIRKCENCPAINKDRNKIIPTRNLLFDKKYIDKTNITLVATSELQFYQAKESYLYRNKETEKIFIPIDPDIFKPINKSELKHKLNIPEYKKIIFFGANYITEIRKGMTYLLKSLELLSRTYEDKNKIMILIAGKTTNGLSTQSIPFEHRYLGYINSQNELAKIFGVSDIFVCPSIQDSGPMMINQSIMCGTPVVAFDMGVANDLVIDNVSGYKAKLKDSKDLANGISKILMLNEIEYNALSKKCREFAIKELHPVSQIKKFENLIRNRTSNK